MLPVINLSRKTLIQFSITVTLENKTGDSTHTCCQSPSTRTVRTEDTQKTDTFTRKCTQQTVVTYRTVGIHSREWHTEDCGRLVRTRKIVTEINRLNRHTTDSGHTKLREDTQKLWTLLIISISVTQKPPLCAYPCLCKSLA